MSSADDRCNNDKYVQRIRPSSAVLKCSLTGSNIFIWGREPS